MTVEYTKLASLFDTRDLSVNVILYNWVIVTYVFFLGYYFGIKSSIIAYIRVGKVELNGTHRGLGHLYIGVAERAGVIRWTGYSSEFVQEGRIEARHF